MTREIAVSLASRLCAGGMAKPPIIAAFRRSFYNSTSFLDELYTSEDADDALIAACTANEAGLLFDEIARDVHVVAPTLPDFVALSHIRHAVVVTSDHTTLIYIAPTLRDIAVLKTHLPQSQDIVARLRITTPARLSEFLRLYYERALADNAVNIVETTSRGFSARIVVTGRQGILLGLLTASILFGLVLAPSCLWFIVHMLFSVFFSGCILLRLLAMRAMVRRETRVLPTVPAYKLPVYSIMIALYKEADVVPQLVRAMTKLNWPRSKLEVTFVCEADDFATIAAFEDQKLPYGFKVIPVPGIGPRTKPKALNYGLQLSRGEFVVVYDAEDRPHPNQLLEAWQRFSAGESNLGCLQAPLVIANAHEGWLARLFAFEYAVHFSGLLPWLARNGLVLPLGGSSNHFRRSCLEGVGGWDPYNVTEDAELGTRLARRGFHVEMLSLPTIEDAPTTTDVWLPQRTRWLKGWMQTWLFEMRHPKQFLRDLGFRRFLVYHTLMAGLIVSSLLYPLILVFIAYSGLNLILDNAAAADRGILVYDCMNITMGYLSFHALGKRSSAGKEIKGSILRVVPFYWMLVSVAAWRAVKQLYTQPFLWEKTPHRPAAARESPDPSR
ncbi:glycosyltransferase [Phyllobacterium zundukense]|uniref:Glycosyltransferase n=1 Tax=Phyllobacterium zundukense TaxID=1867719 RepID=A0ACD4D5V2_9HYPH|nr:glycosyltransferase [Phyllobacterium zundukense]UXN61256.1 glycosyltransferase [Phyllobacterium zundukense]